MDGSLGEGIKVGQPVKGSTVSPWMGDRVGESSVPCRLGSVVLVPCRLGVSVVVVPSSDGVAVIVPCGLSVLPPVLVGGAETILSCMLGVKVIVVPEGGAVMLPSFVEGLGVIVGSVVRVVVGARVRPSVGMGSSVPLGGAVNGSLVLLGSSGSSVWVVVGASVRPFMDVGSSVPLGGTVNGTVAAAVLGAIVGSTSKRIEGISLEPLLLGEGEAVENIVGTVVCP